MKSTYTKSDIIMIIKITYVNTHTVSCLCYLGDTCTAIVTPIVTPSEVPISILSESPSLESDEVICVSRPGGVVM